MLPPLAEEFGLKLCTLEEDAPTTSIEIVPNVEPLTVQSGSPCGGQQSLGIDHAGDILPPLHAGIPAVDMALERSKKSLACPDIWDEFRQVEFFDSAELKCQHGGMHKNHALYLTAGSKEFRFDVHNLPSGLGSTEQCPFEMEHPMLVMRGSHVKQIDHMMSHNEARTADVLFNISFETYTLRETVNLGFPGATDHRKHVVLAVAGDRILNPLHRIVYVAHHWQTPDAADDAEHSKLRLLQGTLEDSDYVWLDVWSIPNLLQLLPLPSPLAAAALLASGVKESAIRSMQAYVFHATLVRVVSLSEEDLELFFGRTWCQAELFAALCPVVHDRHFAVAGKRGSFSTTMYKHACTVEVVVQGAGHVPLDLARLQNPLTCRITDVDDLPLLRVLLQKIRELVHTSVARRELNASSHDRHEEVVSGIEISVSTLLADALSGI